MSDDAKKPDPTYHDHTGMQFAIAIHKQTGEAHILARPTDDNVCGPDCVNHPDNNGSAKGNQRAYAQGWERIFGGSTKTPSC